MSEGTSDGGQSEATSKAASERDLRNLLGRAKLTLRLFGDPRVPLPLKLIPIAAVVYLLSPFDLLPDVVPVVTQIDDLAVMLLAIRLFVDMAPQDVVAEHTGANPVSTTYRVHE